MLTARLSLQTEPQPALGLPQEVRDQDGVETVHPWWDTSPAFLLDSEEKLKSINFGSQMPGSLASWC